MTKKEIIQYFINNIDTLVNNINSRLFDRYEKDMDKIIKREISKFYASYAPRYYKRKYSLKDMYKIKKNKSSFAIDFDGKYTPKTHRVDNSYIYETVFKEGWHGGAKKIDPGKADKWGNHPDPGTPYWRKPPKPWEDDYGNEHAPYTEWGAMAASSLSPWNRISRAVNAYNNTVEEIQNQIIEEEILKMMNMVR